MQRRIFAWPGVGPAVEDFLTHGVIRPKSKLAAYLGIVLAVMILVLLSSSMAVTGVGIALILLGALYVATRPSEPR